MHPDVLRLEEQIAQRRQQFLGDVGHLHNPDGVDIAGITRFFRALDLPSCDALIVDDAHCSPMNRALGRAGLPPMGENWMGVQYPEIGLAIIERGPYSTSNLNALVTHELAHSTSGNQRLEKGGRAELRDAFFGKRPKHFNGFRGFHGGSLTEEGWCDLITATYREVVVGVQGYTFTSEMTYPAKFPKLNHYTYGALALDVLCHYNPKLVEKMLIARTQPAAMQEVITTVNDIEKGLFYTMHSIGHSRNVKKEKLQFSRFLDHVLEVGGHTRGDIPNLCDQSPVGRFVAAKLLDVQEY